MSRPRRAGASRATGPTQRQLRVGELVRHALADILGRAELQDPDLVGVSITVTEVRTSPDLRHAAAFIMPLGGVDAEKVRAALTRAAPYLRGALGREVELRSTPQLSFVLDQSFDEADRISALLRSPVVARDLADDEDADSDGTSRDDDSA